MPWQQRLVSWSDSARWMIASLLILVPTLCWYGSSNDAHAAWAQDALSDYLVVTGRSGRGDEEVLWVLDTRSEELLVVGWDRQERRFVPLGRRLIANDVAEALRGR